MDPSLLQQSYSVDYPTNAENRYLVPERSYQASAPLSANDFSILGRESHNNRLASGSLAQSLALPTNSRIDFNSHQHLMHDTPYHSTSHLMLSPPSSIDGTSTANLHPSATYNRSNSTRQVSDNVSSTNQYSATSASFIAGNWTENSMNDYSSRPRAMALPPGLSHHPLTYSNMNAAPSQFLSNLNQPADQYNINHSKHRTFQSSEIMHGSSNNKLKSPILSDLNNPGTYNFGFNYSSMPPQMPSRPEGPPFEPTQIILPLVNERHQNIIPEICANIQKGFFQVEGKWTCYRRNYFSVQCAFHFRNAAADERVYLQRNSQLEQVYQYAVSISAKTANGNSQESETRALVQHTPKRDKATESTPGRHTILASSSQSLNSTGSITNSAMYSGSQHVSPGILGQFDGYMSQGHHQLAPACHTFERIQFQRATANNGKRRAQQQYFHIIVELSVNIGRSSNDENWMTVATRSSHPMVVRGRSPGHYKDNNQRNGSTNMDSDRHNGAGTDGGSGSYSLPALMGQHPSSMDWSSNQRSHNQNYGQSYTRTGGDKSPSSPSAASDGSSLSLNGAMMDAEYQSPLSKELSASRAINENVGKHEHQYYNNNSMHDACGSPTYEVPMIHNSRPLYAS